MCNPQESQRATKVASKSAKGMSRDVRVDRVSPRAYRVSIGVRMRVPGIAASSGVLVRMRPTGTSMWIEWRGARRGTASCGSCRPLAEIVGDQASSAAKGSIMMKLETKLVLVEVRKGSLKDKTYMVYCVGVDNNGAAVRESIRKQMLAKIIARKRCSKV
ncbi:hypothetical protein BV22DRAFT_1046181 [Leucogyrophana mollusca]|uniref:Uncharacterized protein n=1 Tax=Leucogyrophana mollusca TaxID=85980 RepID=A0ACB8BK79_9AGAM|nr:hypothetical protein BV22DRAFT_1046181 [Leucogyrophana mollusca]